MGGGVQVKYRGVDVNIVGVGGLGAEIGNVNI